MLRHALLSVFLFAATGAGADTRMLAEPAISDTHVVFAFDHDLWLVGREGGTARRLTGAAGRERNPMLSPDGAWLAFSAPYAGQLDVYVMPAGGGEVRRLTWHPGNDIVRGFTPDSGAVVFQTLRSVHTNRHRHLYTVPVDGGVPTQLPVPTGYKAALSPDGRRIAYTPHGEAFRQWKNYRGGTVSRIWIMDLETFDVVEIPKPTTGANDTDPMWHGERLYFNSDRDGEFNLYRYDPDGGTVTRLTTFDDFPVLNPAIAADGTIVFELAGRLHTLDTATGHTTPLAITARSDLGETRARVISGAKWVRAAAPSPGLNRVAFEYRGEIVTVPAKDGDPRVLTRDSGVHNRSPAWSPNGERIAWFADAGGEYLLRVMAQNGRGDATDYPLEGAGFYDQPQWSPDGAYIAYRDNSQSLWVIELDSGRQTRIASEPVYSPINRMTAAWSPDSRWLAYTVQRHGLINTVYAWSVDDRNSIQLTDGLSEMGYPVFDPDGDYLYVLAATDAGPVKDWFSQSNTDLSKNEGIYAITLSADGPDPLPPLSDEVRIGDEEDHDDNNNDHPPRVRIDPEGLGDRITALPVGTANRRALTAGSGGNLYWIEAPGAASFAAFDAPGELKRFNLKERETTTLAADVADFALGDDGEKILYRIDSDWFVNEANDELPTNRGKLALDAIQIPLDPRAEWRQILREAWRINRDYFYDPGFHGADWDAMWEKYAAFLPDLATRYDLDRVMRWMLSELAVGHSYLQPGDYPQDPDQPAAGLLGADLEVADGRWQFTRVYGGLNWDPDLKAPLRTAGVHVASGEYLLAIDGVEVRPPDSPYRYLAGKRDRQVTLTVGPRADGRDARDVTVVPTGNDANLRYLDWVESNMRYVHEQTGGRVAYVHVPNTADLGHAMFKRYFYPQSHKQALIVDERYNGGGRVADYYIDILRREYVAHWNLRYGEDHRTPRAAILGPKVMITDETAGSGGDLLPWMFQQFELGPVIGKRTWGGLVGMLGFPVLRDGGSITAPNLAFWTEAEGFGIENVGVPPDIEVEQWPVEVNAGRDPQLERAIEEVLEQLETHPPVSPQRPDYPVRAR